MEGESGADVTRPRSPVAVSVGFIPGLGVGVGFELSNGLGEGSEGIVSPHLGKKHDVILTIDASGRSKSNTLLFGALLLSVPAELGAGSRMPGTKDVAREGSGVIGRLLPALAGSELEPSPVRLRKSNFLAIPLPRPKLGGVRLLKTDPKRPFDFCLVLPWTGVMAKVNAASELE